MSVLTSYEFDEKNESDYDDNTYKINAALNKIEKDKKLSASLAELSRQSGLHRNSLRDRAISIGELKRETTVSNELQRIKLVKKVKAECDKKTKKDTLREVEELLDKSKVELVYWFTKFRDMTLEFRQMEIQLSRKIELVDWYKNELEKERLNVKSLEERINLLEELNK